MNFTLSGSGGQNAEVIKYAKRIGTYGQIDRSAQYEGRYSTEVLRRNDDILFARWRQEEKVRLRDQAILICVSAFVAALISWAPKIIEWFLQ
jgi:hypothetical protein